MMFRSEPTSKISVAFTWGRDVYRDAAWSIWVGIGMKENPAEGERRYLRNFEWSTAFLPYFLRCPDGINGVCAFGRCYVWRRYRPERHWP